MKIKIINKSKHILPTYATSGASGLDLRANIDSPISINPGDWVLVPTALFLSMPLGMEAQVRPRSGLAFKYGITVLNSPGTIDSDYQGELKILLINLSKEIFIVKDGERIAQLVFTKVETIKWENVAIFDNNSQRGHGGFGHTGIK